MDRPRAREAVGGVSKDASKAKSQENADKTEPKKAADSGKALEGRQLWLMKSEPDVYSLDTLRESPGGRGFWDGVRNFQARNMLQQQR